MQTLVLIPGYGFSSAVWNDFINKLPGTYSIIKLDLPLNPEHLFAYLAEMIPSQAILCGWSLGGLIATKFCTLFPKKNNKLITIASSPNFYDALNLEWLKKLRNLLKKDLDKFIHIFLCSVLYPNIKVSVLRELKAHFIRDVVYLEKYLDFLINTNVFEDYKTLKCSSFHINFLKDAIVSHETLLQWKINPLSETFESSLVGHYPFFNSQILIVEIERWIIKNSN